MRQVLLTQFTSCWMLTRLRTSCVVRVIEIILISMILTTYVSRSVPQFSLSELTLFKSSSLSSYLSSLAMFGMVSNFG